LSEPLLDLGVEPLEVQLVELLQIFPVGGVHRVEPVHELVRDILAESLVELL
jgi:hypothetical protein